MFTLVEREEEQGINSERMVKVCLFYVKCHAVLVTMALVCLEIRYCDASSFVVFAQDYFGYLQSLVFHIFLAL